MFDLSGTSAIYIAYSNMPNSYITKRADYQYNNERELYDLMITEVYNKHGVSLSYYITSYDTAYDKIFGEDNNRRFVRKFNFMSFFSLPREEKLWTKFGIDGMDQFSMFVSKRHFREASTYDYKQLSANTYASVIPRIGDIIMSDYAQYAYEITEVKEEVGMALLSKQHIWELIVKPFRDERIAVPSDVSATMPEMNAISNKPNDVMDITTNIDAKKPNIIYQPKPGELPGGNPFSNFG